jgi:hypothetical protein
MIPDLGILSQRGPTLNKGELCHWGFVRQTWDHLRSRQHFPYFLASKHTHTHTHTFSESPPPASVRLKHIQCCCFRLPPPHCVTNTADPGQGSPYYLSSNHIAILTAPPCTAHCLCHRTTALFSSSLL